MELAEDLRLAGHDADTVADENLIGASDAVIVSVALREKRIRSRLSELPSWLALCGARHIRDVPIFR